MSVVVSDYRAVMAGSQWSRAPTAPVEEAVRNGTIVTTSTWPSSVLSIQFAELLHRRVFPLLDVAADFPPCAGKLEPIFAEYGGLAGLKDRCLVLASKGVASSREALLLLLRTLTPPLDELWQRRVYRLPELLEPLAIYENGNGETLVLWKDDGRREWISRLTNVESPWDSYKERVLRHYVSTDARRSYAVVESAAGIELRDLITNRIIEAKGARAVADSTVYYAARGAAGFATLASGDAERCNVVMNLETGVPVSVADLGYVQNVFVSADGSVALAAVHGDDSCFIADLVSGGICPLEGVNAIKAVFLSPDGGSAIAHVIKNERSVFIDVRTGVVAPPFCGLSDIYPLPGGQFVTAAETPKSPTALIDVLEGAPITFEGKRLRPDWTLSSADAQTTFAAGQLDGVGSTLLVDVVNRKVVSLPGDLRPSSKRDLHVIGSDSLCAWFTVVDSGRRRKPVLLFDAIAEASAPLPSDTKAVKWLHHLKGGRTCWACLAFEDGSRGYFEAVTGTLRPITGSSESIICGRPVRSGVGGRTLAVIGEAPDALQIFDLTAGVFLDLPGDLKPSASTLVVSPGGRVFCKVGISFRGTSALFEVDRFPAFRSLFPGAQLSVRQ